MGASAKQTGLGSAEGHSGQTSCPDPSGAIPSAAMERLSRRVAAIKGGHGFVTISVGDAKLLLVKARGEADCPFCADRSSYTDESQFCERHGRLYRMTTNG